MKTIKVKWYQSLNTQGILGLVAVTLWLIFGLILVMKTRGQKLILQESSKLVEEIGNNAVADLKIRTSEIAALTRTLGTTAEELPKNDSLFKEILPDLINFQNDLKVAGGGFWPEPYQFNPKVERNSFFWGRNQAGILQFYDDYNQPGNGYHNEEWYVVVRYFQPRQCFWSSSYIDPYSYQPMVTCSVATFKDNQFSGVVTIDLKLEGLQEWVKSWESKTGGYGFIVDRNNKFITFPDPSLVRKNQTEDFILSSQFSEKQPLFLPIAQSLEQVNQDLIESAKKSPRYNHKIAENIDRDSYQIDLAQAELINAIITNYTTISSETYLVNKITIDQDFLLGEPATAFVFFIPDSAWKFVIVQPKSKAVAVANNIILLLTIYLISTIVMLIVIAYFLLRKLLIKPLIETSEVMDLLSNLVIEKRYDDLKDCKIRYHSNNEIGRLAIIFNTLTRQLAEVTKALKQLQQTQAQLIHSEKMSSLGEMVAGIAHEINNPINFIYGNVTHITEYSNQLLEIIKLYQETYPDLIPEMAEYLHNSDLEFIEEDLPKILDSMKNGAIRIRELVLSLRNFSRLDEAEMKPVNIHEGIDNTLLLLKHKLEEDNSALEIIKDYGDLPLVECYAGQLNQVFMSLLDNAIDALISDNLDPLKAKQIKIKTELLKADLVRITIGDNGKGISEDIKGKIFDPFFTTKPVGKGTGLGLSISYQIIVEQHQGSLSCHSEVGKGTEFIIEIPTKS